MKTKAKAATAAVASMLAIAASPARAAITAWWQPAPITATTDGVTPPPGIQGYETWDVMISLTPGDDFTSFRLLFDPIGPIFHHSLGGGAPNFGPPNSALFPTFPVLEFDSYLRGPADGVTVLGSTDGTNDLPPPGIFDNDKIAVAAGDLVSNTQGGIFQLVRVTWSGPAPTVESGRLAGRVFSVQDPVGVQIYPPEPSVMLTGVVFAGLALLRRPRA